MMMMVAPERVMTQITLLIGIQINGLVQDCNKLPLHYQDSMEKLIGITTIFLGTEHLLATLSLHIMTMNTDQQFVVLV